jgi:hypothetical protein
MGKSELVLRLREVIGAIPFHIPPHILQSHKNGVDLKTMITGQVDIKERSETPERKKALLEALEDKYGIVTDACRATGVERSTFYEWLKIDPEFKASVDEIQETAIDYVEGKLFERISGVEVMTHNSKGEEVVYSLPPDVPAISLYLKTRGKKRGYVERTELTGADGKAMITETHVKIIRDKGIESSPVDTASESAESS